MKQNIIVEGNIGTGKSTFLTALDTHLGDKVNTIQEPVNEWFKVKDENGVSLFEHFYQDPSQYSFLLQMNILSSRYSTLMEHITGQEGVQKVNVFERSIFTDRHVFVESLYDLKHMTSMEYEVFSNMFQTMKPCTNRIDGIIYLKCSPEVSHTRVLQRQRTGEQTITLDYLQTLHDKHEEWLKHSSDIPVFVLDVSRKALSDYERIIKHELMDFIHE